MAKQTETKAKTAPAVDEQSYYFPREGVSVSATSYGEALAKLKAQQTGENVADKTALPK